jgi:hypothetical protein
MKILNRRQLELIEARRNLQQVLSEINARTGLHGRSAIRVLAVRNRLALAEDSVARLDIDGLEEDLWPMQICRRRRLLLAPALSGCRDDLFRVADATEHVDECGGASYSVHSK